MALSAHHLAGGLALLLELACWRLIQASFLITASRTASSLTAIGAATRTLPSGG